MKLSKVTALLMAFLMVASVPANVYAASNRDFSTRFRVDGMTVNCDIMYNSLYDTATIAMNSSWQMEMKIDGYVLSYGAELPVYKYSENTYGIQVSKTYAYGVSGVDVICWGCSEDGVSNQINPYQDWS